MAGSGHSARLWMIFSSPSLYTIYVWGGVLCVWIGTLKGPVMFMRRRSIAFCFIIHTYLVRDGGGGDEHGGAKLVAEALIEHLLVWVFACRAC